VKRSTSLARRVTGAAGIAVVATALAGGFAARVGLGPAWVLGLALLAGSLVGALALRRVLHPVSESLRALLDGVRGFKEADFSLRLAVRRDDEIGELLELYNAMGDALREERHDLYQRELLLDTVLQGAPVAVLLSGPTGRVVYANRAARDLLTGGRRVEGHTVEEVTAGCRPELRAALQAGREGLVSVPGADGEEDTFRTARRTFHINGQPHQLALVERLTPELRRREVEVWKKAIRVMNHELNNSLAPIRSLVHSGRAVLDKPDHLHLLPAIFETIEERATHLARFLEGYARFARLPSPRPQEVPWGPFVEALARLTPFQVTGAVPAHAGYFDPAQMQQALINLLKNAHESGSAADDVLLGVARTVDGADVVQVLDRGRGMEPEVMSRALLPFYSSKASGTGLGLPLCKEILEAHGGRLHLQNREGGGLAVTCWLPPR
jgi:two-component system nitrogen regulation sensor histidine kinase NtrY